MYEAYDNILFPLYISDIETYEILYQNASCIKLLGDVKGQKCHKAICGNESKCSDCVNVRALENNSKYTVTKNRYNLKSGLYFDAHESIITLFDGNKARFCIMLDITETNKLKEELRQSKEIAEAASLAKSNFISNLSHEIRTPLNAIIGLTEIAKKSENVVKIKDSVKKIEASSEQLLKLINDVTDISKIESGKVKLNNEDFSLYKMINKISVLIGANAEKKCIDFKTEIEKEVPDNVFGDPFKISRIIVNLLSNAVKFTPANGTVRFTVKATDFTENSINVSFVVTDNGIGISKKLQKNIFDAFEQAEQGNSNEYEGAGLGLAISLKTAEIMNGTISLQSEEGKGSTFEFSVRLSLSFINSLIDEEAENSSYNTLFPDKNILIAEDIEINKEILMAVFQETGLNLDFADNGNIAVEKFKKNTTFYDLIFMDVLMPLLDGYEATKEIRESGLPGSKRIPIIAMTAKALTEDIKKCEEAGMNGHISKPIDIDEVFFILNKYLG